MSASFLCARATRPRARDAEMCVRCQVRVCVKQVRNINSGNKTSKTNGELVLQQGTAGREAAAGVPPVPQFPHRKHRQNPIRINPQNIISSACQRFDRIRVTTASCVRWKAINWLHQLTSGLWVGQRWRLSAPAATLRAAVTLRTVTFMRTAGEIETGPLLLLLLLLGERLRSTTSSCGSRQRDEPRGASARFSAGRSGAYTRKPLWSMRSD